MADHVILLYCLSLFLLLGSVFWLSSRLTRWRARRDLSAESCPHCDAPIGPDTAAATFGNYSRHCIDFIKQARGAFSIDLGPPMDFVCPSCGAHLFFDYLDSNEVLIVDIEEVNKAEQATPYGAPVI